MGVGATHEVLREGMKLPPLLLPQISDSATPQRRNTKLCTHLPYPAEVVCKFDANSISDDVINLTIDCALHIGRAM